MTFAVGVFAVGEALWVASRLRHGPLEIIPAGGSWMTRQDFRRSWRPWLRGTALGFPIGAMPAGGAEIPTFLSYAVEKKLSKHKDEFGTTGAIEGVAGPEAANNAAAAGVLVPLLTLGLPTSATAAVLIAAFQSYGIQPGPLLFQNEGPPGVGADRQPLRRQRPAAGPEPAAGRALGAAAPDPAALPLRRHPDVRGARWLRAQRGPHRPLGAAGDRHPRLT